MKRLIFTSIVFLISVFLISHLYTKAFGAELENITDKKQNNLVVISTINLPTIELIQIYDRGSEVVCYIVRGKAHARGGPLVPSMECMPITEISRAGIKFVKQYE